MNSRRDRCPRPVEQATPHCGSEKEHLDANSVISITGISDTSGAIEQVKIYRGSRRGVASRISPRGRIEDLAEGSHRGSRRGVASRISSRGRYGPCRAWRKLWTACGRLDCADHNLPTASLDGCCAPAHSRLDWPKTGQSTRPTARRRRSISFQFFPPFGGIWTKQPERRIQRETACTDRLQSPLGLLLGGLE